MTVPTNFYTQAPSLLPQGLQSMISSGQLGPNGPMTVPQQPQMPYAMQPQIPINWNQQAQQAAPIYQPPPSPVQAPMMQPPSVQASPTVRPLGASMQMPWVDSASGGNTRILTR